MPLNASTHPTSSTEQSTVTMYVKCDPSLAITAGGNRFTGVTQPGGATTPYVFQLDAEGELDIAMIQATCTDAALQRVSTAIAWNQTANTVSVQVYLTAAPADIPAGEELMLEVVAYAST